MALSSRKQRRTTAHNTEAGFSLVEVLVALGIFSIAVIAHIHLQGENARTISYLEEKALGRMVAENELALALAQIKPLTPGTSNGEAELGGREWSWTRRVIATQERSMLRIVVSVNPKGREDTMIAQATGFREAKR